jgi:hypothetical protein
MSFLLNPSQTVFSLTFIRYNNVANSATIAIEANARAGDFAILFDGSNVTATVPTPVIPSGWTAVANSATTLFRSIISYKILTSADLGTTVTGMFHANGAHRKIMAIFRPNRGIISVANSVAAGESTTGNPIVQNLLISAAAPPALGFCFFRSSGAISPRTVSPAFTMELASQTTSAYAQFVSYNANPIVNHTVDMDDEGQQVLQSVYFTFT